MQGAIAAVLIGQFLCPGGNCGGGNGFLGMIPNVSIQSQSAGIRGGFLARLFGNAGPYSRSMSIGIGRNAGLSPLAYGYDGGGYGYGGFSYGGGFSTGYAVAPSVQAAPSVQYGGGCYSSGVSYGSVGTYAAPAEVITPAVERIPYAEPGPPLGPSGSASGPAIYLDPPRQAPARVRTVIVLPPATSSPRVARQAAPAPAPRARPPAREPTSAERLLPRFDSLERGIGDIGKGLAARDEDLKRLARGAAALELRVADLEAWLKRNDPAPELRPVGAGDHHH